MEKKGRIYYELSEDEYEDLNDLLIKVKGYCDSSGLYLDEDFKRIFIIMCTDAFDF